MRPPHLDVKWKVVCLQASCHPWGHPSMCFQEGIFNFFFSLYRVARGR